MKFLPASTLAAAIVVASTAAIAADSGSNGNLSCAIGYVTGVGGAADSMREYLATNPKDRNGRHVYSLAQFGLDTETERARYREYWDRWRAPTPA